MSRKVVILPSKLVDAASLSGNFTSDPLKANVDYIDNIALQLNWSGSAVGTFSFEASVDGKIFFPLVMSDSIAAAGTSDSALVSFNQFPYHSLRVVYTSASGTGSLDVFIQGKAI